jgi:histidinol-phosphate aminotransferase
MTQSIHYLARKELAEMPLPRPIAQYRPGVTERLYTNPFAGEYREYPCPIPYSLYNDYANILNVENKNKDFYTNDILPLTAENIIFTAGSIMGIDLIIRGFCEPGKDSVTITTPTFNGYMQYAKVNLVKVVDVPLSGENFDLIDIEKIIEASSKINFLCVPSNPIGTCLSKDAILSVLDRAHGLVVMDEAYIDLSDMPSSTSLLKKYPNLVVLRTFSKAWGLAGIRAGAVLASPEVIAVLGRIQDPFSVSTPVQQALKKAFLNQSSYQQGICDIKASRKLIQDKLKSYSFIERIYPSHTNFILARISNTTSLLNEIRNSQCLLDQGPIEVPFSIKISIGNISEQNDLIDFLNRFKETVC